LTIKATDYVGNSNESTVDFFIDAKPPKIRKTEPRRNKITNGSFFQVKYTEDNPVNISLIFNPTIQLENCTSGRNQYCSTSINLSEFDGTWIDYYFKISDGINIVQSKTTRVFVDTISPILTINSPENITYGRRVPFNITISEPVRLEYYDESRDRWRRLCSNCDDYGFDRKKTKSFKRGTHNIQIRAKDKAGNSDTQQVSFNVIY